MDRRLALVTGASAGIGAAFARILASHGYDLALTARRADRLDTLAEEISLRYGVEALTVTADLAEPEAPGQILDFLTAHGRTVDALVNNAGYGLPGAYADTRWEDQRAFMQVMMTAPGRAGAPGAARHGRTGGSGGSSTSPRWRAWSPARRATPSMARPRPSWCGSPRACTWRPRAQGVHVTALCPGFTYSEFHDVNGTRAPDHRSRRPPWLWLGADEVAAAGYEAVEANRADLRPRRAQQGHRRRGQADPRRLGAGADGLAGAAVPEGVSGRDAGSPRIAAPAC